MSKRKATLGTVVRSGRNWRARYERLGIRHTPGHTFSTEAAAWSWLRGEQTLIDRDTWTPPAARRAGAMAEQAATELTFDIYAREWITNRVTPKGSPLHPRTRAEYLRYLTGILQPLAARPLVSLTSADVARWHGSNASTPSLRHKAYAFAKSVMASAIEVDELASKNPFIVENASRKPGAKVNPDRAVKALDHTLVRQLAELVRPRDRVLLLLLAYCCLRTSEACALRRRDVEFGTADGLPHGWLTVERAISSYDGQRHEGDTKTGAQGERVVPIPPHLLPELDAHLSQWAGTGRDGLLFPSTNPAMDFRTSQQINGHAEVLDKSGRVRKAGFGWYHARRELGLPLFRLHWLRHWGATLWDEAGTPEAMRRAILGHAQPGMTGSYTHPDTTKASPYALRVSELAGWTAHRSPEPTATLGPLLAALDDATLAQILSRLDAVQVAELVPQLPAERIAAVLGHMRLAR